MLIFLELLHCVYSRLVFDVTDDVIHNNESAVTYFSGFICYYFKLCPTNLFRLQSHTIRKFLQISHRNDLHFVEKHGIFWWRHHHCGPWSHLLRDNESSEWCHHNMACHHEQMRILALKCIRASKCKRRECQFFTWTGGSWHKLNTEASLEWKLTVSSEPDAKNWVTG